VAEGGARRLEGQWTSFAGVAVASANRRQGMENLINTPLLGAIGDYIQWWQWLLIGVLVVLIVVYMKMKNKQT
jgi:hypothetical protein